MLKVLTRELRIALIRTSKFTVVIHLAGKVKKIGAQAFSRSHDAKFQSWQAIGSTPPVLSRRHQNLGMLSFAELYLLSSRLCSLFKYISTLFPTL